MTNTNVRLSINNNNNKITSKKERKEHGATKQSFCHRNYSNHIP
eukprot:CAMPEP_0118686236 /NCGR_PEP_ID=MMETSP0800-20121206/7699_1 /TAXON_ID=210618 ORGANISM="Striatella unipunctata, Strain CCMP2910" /NCGR_SAMPLE_ID=MMETSP0800 /ASSEMBLY_ACC=CAM_ASM_000638 /LENGTH=43 /DNA_ID= /DNA_START= /DNA_END= /DNA_ORIENTATION=